MDEFEYEEAQWTEWEDEPMFYNSLDNGPIEFDYLYDQKFVDTLSFIASLPEVK